MQANTTIAARIRAALAARIVAGNAAGSFAIYLPAYGLIGRYDTAADARRALCYLPLHLRASAAITDADGNILAR